MPDVRRGMYHVYRYRRVLYPCCPGIDVRVYNSNMPVYSAVPSILKQAVPPIYLGMQPLPLTYQRPWSTPGQTVVKGVNNANSVSTLRGISVGGVDMAFQKEKSGNGFSSGRRRRTTSGRRQMVRRSASSAGTTSKSSARKGRKSSVNSGGKTRLVTLKNGRTIKMRNGRFVK